MTITEKCSCTAEFSLAISDTYRATAQEALKEWRANHKHEFPPAEPVPEEPSLIHESVSHHERLADEFPPERGLIGFQRN